MTRMRFMPRGWRRLATVSAVIAGVAAAVAEDGYSFPSGQRHWHHGRRAAVGLDAHPVGDPSLERACPGVDRRGPARRRRLQTAGACLAAARPGPAVTMPVNPPADRAPGSDGNGGSADSPRMRSKAELGAAIHRDGRAALVVNTRSRRGRRLYPAVRARL